MADDFPFAHWSAKELRAFNDILLDCFSRKDEWNVTHVMNNVRESVTAFFLADYADVKMNS